MSLSLLCCTQVWVCEGRNEQWRVDAAENECRAVPAGTFLAGSHSSLSATVLHLLKETSSMTWPECNMKLYLALLEYQKMWYFPISCLRGFRSSWSPLNFKKFSPQCLWAGWDDMRQTPIFGLPSLVSPAWQWGGKLGSSSDGWAVEGHTSEDK